MKEHTWRACVTYSRLHRKTTLLKSKLRSVHKLFTLVYCSITIWISRMSITLIIFIAILIAKGIHFNRNEIIIKLRWFHNWIPSTEIVTLNRSRLQWYSSLLEMLFSELKMPKYQQSNIICRKHKICVVLDKHCTFSIRLRADWRIKWVKIWDGDLSSIFSRESSEVGSPARMTGVAVPLVSGETSERATQFLLPQQCLGIGSWMGQVLFSTERAG